eukprot:352902-Chlamydomonas_euryale.AAC.2
MLAHTSARIAPTSVIALRESPPALKKSVCAPSAPLIPKADLNSRSRRCSRSSAGDELSCARSERLPQSGSGSACTLTLPLGRCGSVGKQTHEEGTM